MRILKSESKKALHLVVSDIESVVLDETKRMEDDLIDSLADCIQKKDRKHSVSSARRISKARIDKLENRVCGKDLISALSKWTQSNFNVSLSPIKIAACIEVPEISTELKTVLQKIEKCQDF